MDHLLQCMATFVLFLSPRSQLLDQKQIGRKERENNQPTIVSKPFDRRLYYLQNKLQEVKGHRTLAGGRFFKLGELLLSCLSFYPRIHQTSLESKINEKNGQLRNNWSFFFY